MNVSPHGRFSILYATHDDVSHYLDVSLTGRLYTYEVYCPYVWAFMGRNVQLLS